MPHQLVAVEVTGLTVVPTLQLLQFLAHGMEHGIVFVQRNLSDLEKILRRVIRVCLVNGSRLALAFDLFTEECSEGLAGLGFSAARAIPA